jgi:hypothetical protein
MDEQLWGDGEPSDFGVEVFTAGNCWVLAYYLHELGGWPIVMVVPQADPDMWEHVLVQLPDHRYLDIEGVHTRAEVLKRWGYGGSYRIVPIGPMAFASWEAYHSFLGQPSTIYLERFEETQMVAQLLVAREGL